MMFAGVEKRLKPAEGGNIVEDEEGIGGGGGGGGGEI